MAAVQRRLDALVRQPAIVDQPECVPVASSDSCVLRAVIKIACVACHRACAQLIGEHLEPHEALDPAEQSQIIDRLGEEVVGTGFEPSTRSSGWSSAVTMMTGMCMRLRSRT